ncbi:MAG: nuclear transport factor 2 family protein [Planctomycetota bacterium]|nr:nuclear transport factor 2 family protein [Planctomycetota bacterium]
MPTTPAEAAQRQLDAYNARDLEAFLACYAVDCTVRAHPSGEVMMQGQDAMRSRYGKLFEEHPDLHCQLLARVVHEVFAIDHEHVEGLRPDEVVHAVAMYEVRDGLIQNVWFLRDDGVGESTTR